MTIFHRAFPAPAAPASAATRGSLRRRLALPALPALLAIAAAVPVHAAGTSPAPLPSSSARAPQVVQVTAASCRDLQERLDEVMVPLAVATGDGADVLVTMDVEGGHVTHVDTRGGPPAYGRGVRRALRDADCAGAADGVRRLRVHVVDAWHDARS